MFYQGGGRRWCPHRRKDWLSVLVVLLLLLPHPTHSNVPNDFEEASQNDDDIVTLLAEESLISMKGNTSKKQTKDFQAYREETGVETFTSLNRKYESQMNLLSEDAMMMSDLLPSEYNLQLERMKREIVEGSGGVNECTDPEFDVCNGALEQCNDLDNGYECTCIEGYTRENFQCFSEMFRNGAEFGDSVVRFADELSIFIYVSNGILFASKVYDVIWISVNGVISFGRRFGPYYGRLPTYRQNILCPYWTDIDLRVSYASDAGLYYQVYDSDSSGALSLASNFYRRYSSLFNFNPTWLLVVTWRNVAQKYAGSDTRTATFQVMLATDGRATHVLYIYNRLAWRPRGTPISIGYESSNRGDIRGVVIPASGRFIAYTNPGRNTPFPGVWRFDVGGRFINPAAICVNWYAQYLQDYIDNFGVFRRLPRCACSGFWMWWDRRFFFYRWFSDSFGRFNICFRTRFSRRYWPLGRECCYRRARWLTRDSGFAWRYDPWRVPRKLHIEADVTGKENCCVKSSKCFLYRRIRPRRGCYTRLPFFFAWAFGDPHITTLDDVTYIFNGWGEYILINGETVDEQGEMERFMLQARTDLALNKDGNVTKATIFTGFAATDYNDTFNVELNPSRDRFIIFRNGRDISVAFHDDANFTLGDDEGGLTVSRENDDVIGLFASGVSVKVVLGPKLLTVSVGMADQFKGNTTGLMGNFNEDKTDDFIFPNGTQLPANSSEATLYQYGQTWQIDPTNSYLRYPERTTAADFAHPDFEPLYLDEASEEDRNAAIAKCNNDETNLPCIFDFLATRDDTVAQSTSQTDATAAQEREEQSNSAPELSSEKTIIEVTIGQETTFALNATDVDSDTISYDVLESPDSGFSLSEDAQNGTGRAALAKWTPTDASPTSISITVLDTKNATSDPIDVEIRLCDNCAGHGTCDFTRNRTASNDASSDFSLAACNCTTGWSGDDCSVDFDACDEDPCFEGQNCTDFTPEEEAAEGRAYNCSDCPSGYQAVEEKCEDIDECANNTDNCIQECVNTQGSFECACYSGYRLVGSNCQDINECVEALHDCSQICENTAGGFTCSCEDTYDLDLSDNKTCNLKPSNPCASLNCSYGCRTVAGGSGAVECFCESGFEVDPTDNTACKDIDECTQNICSQECNNTDGSFICFCFDGYTLGSDKISCDECPELTYGKNCSEECDCGDRFSRCDPVRGCICNDGWRGTKCDVDVDECTEDPNTCPVGSVCANIDGGRECNCPSGYERQDDGTCTDVDECETEANICSQNCNNVAGSFTCSCRAGYTVSGENCTDVDECAADQNDCRQRCRNVVGSYNCECEFGYRLRDDRVNCDAVEDVCKDVNNLNCSQGCTVKAETEEAFCFCNLGYKLGTDKQTCLDIVECADPTLNKCSHTCTNTLGGFTCSCPIGRKLDSDRVTCKVCDAQHWGVDCAEECGCGVGVERCDPEVGCVCKSGWLGQKCDQDQDECSDTSLSCPENSVCVNNPGSYSCDCRDGYLLNATSSACEDIDECEPDRNTCDQNCENSPGSFTCTCRDGFKRTSDRCENINECETGNNDCEHLCRDTEGSYACSCRPGFALNITTRTSCVSVATCQTLLDCKQNCQNDGGTETCFCNNGFKLDADQKTCVDIDECTEGTDPCAAGGATCSNVDNGGGYTCTCQDGFFLQSGGVSCQECPEGKYGAGCSKTCACNSLRTQSCIKYNGTCVCVSGWEGATCDTDVDECEGADGVDCGNNAECKNLNGSYACECEAGYFRTPSGCTGCDSKHWGKNCANTCICSVNSISCNATNGFCECKDGWQGDDCATDVDECTDTTICSGTANSECANSNGSYACVCKPGYILKPTTNECGDVNECLDGDLNTCTQECTNTEGSFECSCSVGYTGTGNNCNDIDECTANATLCDGTPDSTCKNKPGTYECECNDGYKKNNTVCEDVDECTNTTICDSEPNTECTNYVGSYNCTCKAGYYFNSTTDGCEDVDECAADSTICSTVPDSTCINRNGTYECGCNTGYMRNATLNRCLDVDECANDDTICDGDENTVCENLPGRHHCVCKAGFLRNTTSDLCEDINECNGNHGCTYQCVNFLNGSHTCICQEGFVLNLDGRSCDRVRTIESEVIIDRDVDSATLNNPNTAGYQDLLAAIQAALTVFFRRIFGDAFVSLIVIRLRPGSVVADYNITVNTNLRPNAEGEFVKAADDLLYTNITIGDANNTVIGITVGGTNISSGVCETYKILTDCDPNYICEVTNGVPECKKLPEGSDYRLIIGLSIGIPLFVVVVATIVVLLILRSRKKKSYSDERTENGNDGFARPFASQLATRGGFYNMNRGMYSPDSLSGASSDSDRNKRKKGRSSFRDSAWYSRDDRQVPQERRQPATYDEASNFSWDFLYRMMPPSETFEIRRPHVSASESPLRSTRKNFYSNA